MAFYIHIKKLEETELTAVYTFSPDPETNMFGQLVINKIGGDIQEIQPHPEDLDKRLYVRAARKVFVHHKNGEYPDITSWAS